MSEVWEKIKDYEGMYSVSNLGRVKSHERLVKTRGGSLRNVSERILKLGKDKDGYKIKDLWKEGKPAMFKVHRLVSQAFILNPKNKPEVNHTNGVKDDNRVENLEWVTKSEQRRHAYRAGLQKGMLGEENPMNKLSKEEVLLIRMTKKESPKLSQLKIGRMFGVSQTLIGKILRRKIWREI